MKLELWRPLFDLEKEWDSLFRFPRLTIDGLEFSFRPTMDVTRTDGELVVTAELPGIDPEKDVEVTVDEGVLTIRGEKTEETEVSEDDRYVRERRFGKFERRIPVPEGVTPDAVTAEYDKGVLTVKVRLPEETEPAEPAKIKVTVKEG
ncbi:MAG: Hsp20/alpha crystallin family protein [Acidimicrobiales bacterium]|jgi:HSP20 family molecular chaperone IbpA|nr:Hsp20/alpha crystallin family protein [Acidimicrobiales bacterium]HLV90140.1 Hsp20/alpha crystallin family protein [Acidimicrobiia bacterium]